MGILSLRKLMKIERRPTKQPRRQRAAGFRPRFEALENRALLATVDVTALGAGGWFADDTRNAAGADLVGAVLTHAAKPGQAPTGADDVAISQQLKIVSGPLGSTYGGAMFIDGTSGNAGKSNVSVIDASSGFAAASVLPTTFNASYQWYGQPNPTSRTLAFKIGVQSTDWAASQTSFTALRSGESAWDLVLVHVPAASDNAWSTVNVDATTGTWSVFRQAGNAFFPAPPAAQTLAAWNADAYWGPKLFGAGAKISSVQFGLGSGQRQSIAYVDYLQTNILNGGDLIDFGGRNAAYVDDQASDFQISVDADNSATLTAGDIVTWNPAGAQHPKGEVEFLTFGVNAFLSIQDGVNAVNSGSTVYVAAGTYSEDVSLNKTVALSGAGAGASTIMGAIGGDGATVRVSASNVEIAGFNITRQGNNPADWNNPGLNSAGIAVQGQAVTGMVVHDNLITGNRTGIDVNNSNGHTVRNNVITNNRTGLIFRNQTDNLTVEENEISDNWTVGVLFLDASGGTNSPVQSALNSSFNNNDISGNWYGQVVDRQSGGSLPAPGTTNLKDFSGNWFGTINPVITTANSAEPGYAAQIPVVFGGTAVAPAGQPDIAGSASANIVIQPYLTSGVDTNVETTPGRGTFGFQGNTASLSSNNYIFTNNSGASLIVNKTTGQYVLVDANNVIYAGSGARVQHGELKIHDQSSNGKLDVKGSVDGTINVSLKGKGKPISFTLEALDLLS